MFGHVFLFYCVLLPILVFLRVRGGGPVLSRSLVGPLSQWPLTPVRLQEVFPARHVVFSMPAMPDLGLYHPRSLLRFVTAADWGPHAERLRRPASVFPDVATSPSSPHEAASVPAPPTPSPAMAWLDGGGGKSPGRSSSEDEPGPSTRPRPPTRPRKWADEAPEVDVEYHRPPKKDTLVPRGSVATCPRAKERPTKRDPYLERFGFPKKREPRLRGSVATCPRPEETQDERDHAKEWWPEVASSFCFVKRRVSNFESRPPDCSGNRWLPQIRTQRSSIRLQYGDSLGFRIRILLLCEKNEVACGYSRGPYLSCPRCLLQVVRCQDGCFAASGRHELDEGPAAGLEEVHGPSGPSQVAGELHPAPRRRAVSQKWLRAR